MFRPLGLPTHRYSELISSEERHEAREISAHLRLGEIAEYRLDGLAVGEHALAGALRFYNRGDLEAEPYGEVVLRHYFNAALLTAYASRRLLDTHAFACVCMVHGIYLTFPSHDFSLWSRHFPLAPP
jgi:hypothetical protein